MKTSYIVLIFVAVSALLAACSNSAPACSDQASTDLVIQILNEQYHLNNPNLKLKNVVTVSNNKDTGAHTCSAQLDSPNAIVQMAVSYTISLSDDGKQVIAQVGMPHM